MIVTVKNNLKASFSWTYWSEWYDKKIDYFLLFNETKICDLLTKQQIPVHVAYSQTSHMFLSLFFHFIWLLLTSFFPLCSPLISSSLHSALLILFTLGFPQQKLAGPNPGHGEDISVIYITCLLSSNLVICQTDSTSPAPLWGRQIAPESNTYIFITFSLNTCPIPKQAHI